MRPVDLAPFPCSMRDRLQMRCSRWGVGLAIQSTTSFRTITSTTGMRSMRHGSQGACDLARSLRKVRS